MQSVKSYFNMTLFRKNLARFWPLWALYGVIWGIALPLPFLLSRSSYLDGMGDVSQNILSMAGDFGIVMAAFFGVFCAMAVFSYLYNAKSVSLMHSLPLRREGLFLTNYLSGLSFLVLPQLVIFVLTIGAAGLRGYMVLPQMLTWLLVQILLSLLFYSFAVFCAMFTGNLLALPVFYGILNFLIFTVTYVANQLMRQFVFGFTDWDFLERVALWLTPAGKLVTELRPHMAEGAQVYTMMGIPLALLYAALGLVFAGLALIAYRRRKLESAGDLISIGWVRPIFKYGVAFTSAILIGTWLSDMFRYSLPAGIAPILAFLLFAGIVGYFGAEMLLKKSFKVFRKSWKGCLAVCLVLVGAACAMEFDITGFNRAPNPEAVVSVQVRNITSRPDDSGSFPNLTYTSTEDVARVIALHETVARQKSAILRGAQDGAPAREVSGEYGEETYTTTGLRIVYTLKNGKLLQREYLLPLYREDLERPDSISAQLTALINRPQSIQDAYWEGLPKDAKPVDGTLSSRTTQGDRQEISLGSEENRNLIMAAVKSDLAAGRIGRRFLFSDRERMETCYYNDLTFIFYSPAATQTHTTSMEDGTYPTRRANWSITFTLQTTSTDTIKVLTDLGLISAATPLRTLAGANVQ